MIHIKVNKIIIYIINAVHLGYCTFSPPLWHGVHPSEIQTWDGHYQSLCSCIHNMAILGYLNQRPFEVFPYHSCMNGNLFLS